MFQQTAISNLSKMQAKPFLKWAGGKRKLLEQISQFFPQELKRNKIKRYVEPFIGSGAVFIHLTQKYSIDEFYISDLNYELIIAYQVIQKNVNDLISCLSGLQAKYLSMDESHRKEYYYEVRTKFNQNRLIVDFSNYHPNWIERTAQLIFLNRTCFNGLFRVNSKGEFNVPMGKYKNPLICHTDNLLALSNILQNTNITYGDFANCEEWVNAETFVYFDPPYKPINSTSSFTAYSQQNFNDHEQIRLRDLFSRLNAKGAKLMLSNSDPKNEDKSNDFFESAYQGYNIQRVQATRSINSKGSKRGEINELLIMNYWS